MGVELVHEAFRKGQADVRAAAAELRETRGRVERRINGFLGKGWTGVAAESFVPAWEDWLTGATDLEEGLVAMEELLAATQQDLVEQDTDSQRNLDAISARIIERLG